MNRAIRVSLSVGVFLCLTAVTALSLGAGGSEHDKYAKMLSGEPPEQGGCSGLSVEQLQATNDWIDNPATRIGKTVDNATSKPLSPSNHGYQRHNPFQTAKAMSGAGEQGKNFLARVNAARMHKVLDVAENSAPVDGWEITPTMRAQAREICEHVKSKGRLPRDLPPWVDYRGIDGMNNVAKVAETQELNRSIFVRLRPNQLQDYDWTATRALKELPAQSRGKFAVARFNKGTARLLGRACVVLTVAMLAYDGYRVYADDVSWLDIADENVEGFLASAELVNYPLLQLDKGVKEASGGWVRLSGSAMTTVRTPSPEETQEMIAAIRKIKNVVVTDSRVREVAHQVDEKYRDMVYGRVGTQKNLLRTALESQGDPPPVGVQLLLDWLVPRDERPKDTPRAVEKAKNGDGPSGQPPTRE